MQTPQSPRWQRVAALATILALASAVPVVLNAQGTLSQQVLQLLRRTNTWIGENTYYNLRVPKVAIPSDTDARIYADSVGNLYYDGGLIAGSGGGVTPHNLLSSTHPDTDPGAPSRGAVIVGDSIPAWAAVAPAGVGFVQFDGLDTVFSTDLGNATNVPAGQLQGVLPVISGANLVGLNASNLASGTVPLARLAGITNTQISGSAAIAYSKLALTGSLVNADLSGSAAIAYSKLALSNTLVAGDLTAGAVTMAKIAQAGATSGQAIVWNGSAWAPASVAGGGTVTSVGLSLPGVFSVSGSPVTGSGTLAASLASQLANTIWAAPDGSSGAPTFRALVADDLPASGVSAGTYPSVTVSDRGLVTAAATTIDGATAISGLVPAANGGLGISTVTASTVPVANGAAWVATALPGCTRVWSYNTGTRLFTCATGTVFGTLTASTPLSLTQVWNNAGVTFNGWLVNVTDAASGATSTLADLQVGGTSQFSVRKDGAIKQSGIVFASLGTPTNGTQTYCPDCTYGSNPCSGGSSGAIAKRINGAWRCD